MVNSNILCAPWPPLSYWHRNISQKNWDSHMLFSALRVQRLNPYEICSFTQNGNIGTIIVHIICWKSQYMKFHIQLSPKFKKLLVMKFTTEHRLSKYNILFYFHVVLYSALHFYYALEISIWHIYYSSHASRFFLTWRPS